MDKFLETLKGIWNSFYTDTALTIVYFVIFLLLGLIIIRTVKMMVKKITIGNKMLDNAASSFITSIVTAVLYVCLIILLLSTLGVSTTGIIAGFSAVALAVSLGLQNTLSSITNGIVIIFTKPFKQGDFIDVGGISGTVKNIRLFNTTLNTPDNLLIVVPNNTILSSSLTNYSAMPLRRISIVVPCPYSSDIKNIKDLLMECILADERVAVDPAPFCRLTEFGASSLDFTVRVWVKNSDYWDVRFDLMESIFNKLKDNGISIPYNQLDLHVVDQADLKVSLIEKGDK